MHYTIKAQKILDVFNPFENNLFEHDNVTRSEIETRIKKTQIFSEENDTPKEKSLRKIAYLVYNTKEQNIALGLNGDKLSVNNPADLVAALYANQNVVFFTEDQKLLDMLSLTSDDVVEHTVYKPYLYDWNNILDLTEETWNSDDFVIKKILTMSDNHNERKALEEIFQLTPIEKWKNIDFIKKVKESCEKEEKNYRYYQDPFEKLIEQLPTKVLEGSVFLEYAKETKHNKLIDHYLSLYNSFLKAKEVLAKKDEYYYLSSYGSSCYLVQYLNETKNNSMTEEKEAAYKRVLPLEEKFMEKIVNTLFNDREIAISYIKNNRIDDSSFALFSEELRNDKTILTTLLDKICSEDRNYIDITKLFPDYMFDDRDFQIKVISSMKNLTHDNYLSRLSQNWINNKETILEYGKLIYKENDSDNPYLEVWNLLSKELKKDKDIARFFMGMNYRMYSKLPPELKGDKEFFLAYCDKGEDHKVGRIPASIITAFTKEEMLHLLQKAPTIYNSPHFPEKFKKDPEIIATVLSLFNVSHPESPSKEANNACLTKEDMENIFSNPKIAIDAINSPNTYGRWYTHMPLKTKLIPEVSIAYLEHSHYVTEIPQELFCSKDFCIAVLRKNNHDLNTKIPKDFFRQEDFILEVLKEIDKQKIDASLLNSINNKFSALINSSSVQIGNYYSFFNNIFMNSKLQIGLTENQTVKRRNKI